MVDHRRPADAAKTTLGGFELIRPAEPGTVTSFRHWAATFAAENGAGPDLVNDVSLAVTEATTNAVKYAYGFAGTGTVGLSAFAEEGWLTVRISDQGEGFSEGPSDGLGLGLTIIARLCDQLRIIQEGAGTQVLMRFLLPGC